MTEDIVTSDSLLRDWQALMRRGVDASRQGETMVARRLYLQAQGLTLALLACRTCDAVDDDDRVAAFVVTHLNLADSFQGTGHIALALAQLWTAHQTLMGLLHDERVAMTLRLAALRHSRETSAALVEHSAQHASHPEIVATVRGGCLSVPPPGALAH